MMMMMMMMMMMRRRRRRRKKKKMMTTKKKKKKKNQDCPLSQQRNQKPAENPTMSVTSMPPATTAADTHTVPHPVCILHASCSVPDNSGDRKP